MAALTARPLEATRPADMPSLHGLGQVRQTGYGDPLWMLPNVQRNGTRAMTRYRWWEIVQMPAEVDDIEFLSGTFTMANADGVYIVDLLSNEVLDGPL